MVDWFDLNTLAYLGKILAAIVAIGTPLGIIFGWFKPLLRWFGSLFKRKAQPKSAPISFVPNDLHCHWSEGRLNNEPTTTVHGRWHVTNASESDVMILKARLGKHTAQLSQVTTAHHRGDKRDVFGNYPVRSHQMTEVMAVLEFFPAIHRAQEPIIIDVIFTDNFTNEHRVRTEFYYLGLKPSFVSSPQLSGRVG